MTKQRLDRANADDVIKWTVQVSDVKKEREMKQIPSKRKRFPKRSQGDSDPKVNNIELLRPIFCRPTFLPGLFAVTWNWDSRMGFALRFSRFFSPWSRMRIGPSLFNFEICAKIGKVAIGWWEYQQIPTGASRFSLEPAVSNLLSDSVVKIEQFLRRLLPSPSIPFHRQS